MLNSYNSKNKEFEVEVQKCQDRNSKNSKRNHELKTELDRIQAAMNVVQKRNRQ